ncbi:DNA-binding transcriptional MocR family regulator [Rheinheimera pacifica]|uniref:aminotransferase-like domain-containing protein n=1 Tax=Rheinheimera pacifica TaxID=173990 RepID=UPI0021687AFD|nr:PLP-dependent aminotransferase family protein [Rheinheimera pacifica]MCS4306053.1 DNA-binding transcriptional MocR family regulator [Rheinheimera pacifica]
MGFRYQQLAAELQQQIEQGQYGCGDRLPGVRELAKRRAVSVSTVVASYRRLEADGYLQASSRSGYFVKPRYQPPALSSTLQQVAGPVTVCSQQIALSLSKAAADPAYMRLGAAVPAAVYLPQHALQKVLQQVIKTEPARLMRYEASRGAAELRHEIARRMALQGAVVSQDDVIITNGCQEALMLSLKAVTQPGDVVVIESPAFYGLLQALEAAGLKALALPTDVQTGMAPDVLEQALEQWPVKACVLIANYSNPLGSLIPDSNKKRIVQLLAKRGIALIEDDTYGDLGFTGPRPGSFLALAPKQDIFYCSTFSKTLSPDLRLGWVIAPKHTAKLEYLKFISNISTAALPQLAVAKLLQSGQYERHLRQVRPQYEAAVQRISSSIGRLFPPGTRVSQPQGGFVLWVELPQGTDAYLLTQQALAEKISIAPGTIFSPTAPAGKARYGNFIRLNCAVAQDARLERALQTLGQLCQQQLNQQRFNGTG